VGEGGLCGEGQRGNSGEEFWAQGSERESEKWVVRVITLKWFSSGGLLAKRSGGEGDRWRG